VTERRLRDGSTYNVVKRYWEPQQLAGELETLGWNARVGETEWAFVYGEASRASVS
jgi:hypothetical protein